MGYSLGVDLGTTYTAAAVCRDALAEIVPLGDASSQVPSVVFKPEKGPLLLGDAAARHTVTDPDRIVRDYKRRLGNKTEYHFGDTEMTADELSNEMLNWIVKKVVEGQGEPPTRLTVSCPANWGPWRRESMNDVMAVKYRTEATLCTEPEAAAVHFASTGRLQVGEPIAVYDLGGGTFDAAILRLTDSAEFQLVGSPAGIEDLGGLDFDALLRDHVLDVIGVAADPDDPDPKLASAFSRFARECVEAKEALSVEVAVTIPVVLGTRQGEVRVTRREFEDLIREEIERSATCLTAAISRAGLRPEDLSAIVLVGGSSRIPLVSEVLTERLGRPVAVSTQPKLCVAMGAALIGAASNAAAVAPVILPRVTSTPTARPSMPTPAVEPAQSGVLVPRPDAALIPFADQVPAAPPPVEVTPSAASAAESSAPPRTMVKHRSLPWYRLASAALAAVALLLTLLGASDTKNDLAGTLDVHLRSASIPQVKDGTPLKPLLFGESWGLPAVKAKNSTLNVYPWRVVLGGSIRASLGQGPRRVILTTPAALSWRRLFTTVPGVIAVLGALFSFAYAESLLRGIRKRRRLPSGGEVVGMVGTGAVAGTVVAACRWLVGSSALSTEFVLAVVVCVSAAVGLLAFGWDRQPRNV